MTVAIGQQPASPARLGADSHANPPASKLEKSAHEFEAILLQSWLEKMNQSFVGSQESQNPAHDTVSSLGTQAIANALAARGGIGIAAVILRQLRPGSSPAGKEQQSRQNLRLISRTRLADRQSERL